MDTVRTQALTRHFGAFTALDQLTLSVQEGEIFGLVGPDGAGKTTTMRLLTGILQPSAGEAWVDGLHVVHDADGSSADIAVRWNRDIGNWLVDTPADLANAAVGWAAPRCWRSPRQPWRSSRRSRGSRLRT